MKNCEKGLVPKGLPNLGNTCFYNSALQCLLNTHPIELYRQKVGKDFELCVPECSTVVYEDKVELKEAKIPVTFTKETPFISTFQQLLSEFYSERSPNPRNVFDQVAKRAPRFRGWHQQDSHELLRYLIDGLRQEELNAISSSILDYLKDKGHTDDLDLMKKACLKFAKPAVDCVFAGTLLQTICCSECGHESVCFEPFLDLSLSLPRASAQPKKHDPFMSNNQKKKKNKGGKKQKGKQFQQIQEVQQVKLTGKTIEAALDRFTGVERLYDKNGYECEKCCVPMNKEKGKRHKTVEAEKKYAIHSLPPVLTLHLKRFEKTQQFGRIYTSKVSDHVKFPLILDLAPYCSDSAQPIHEEKSVDGEKLEKSVDDDKPVDEEMRMNESSADEKMQVDDEMTSSNDEKTSETSEGQIKVLYSLYGIVCHSGSLNGGHYIAYVRSRKPVDNIEKFFKQASFFDASALGDLVKYENIQSEASLRKNLNVESASEKEALASLSPSNWYYCSDSHVQRTSEEKVLNAEAFMLFYERFY